MSDEKPIQENDTTQAIGEDQPNSEQGVEKQIVGNMADAIVEKANGDVAIEESENEEIRWVIPKKELTKIVEALLFVSARPLNANHIANTVPQATLREIRQILGELLLKWSDKELGFQLALLSSGYQFRSASECADYIRELQKTRPMRLSRAALETLAIVAYRQPLTRAEVEDIRGVDSGGVMKMLLERKLLRILGKREEPGRPLIYGTSREFLETFNLRTLKDLPTLKEYEELTAESRAKVDATFPREEEESISEENDADFMNLLPNENADDSRAMRELTEAAERLELAVNDTDETVKEIMSRTPYDELGEGEDEEAIAEAEIIAAPESTSEGDDLDPDLEDEIEG